MDIDGSLFSTQSVDLDSSGNGSVRIGPQGEDWTITSLTVATSTNTLKPIARVYRGLATNANASDGTYDGSIDTTNTPIFLFDGLFLTITWTAGDAGARATVTVSGTKKMKNVTAGIFRAF